MAAASGEMELDAPSTLVGGASRAAQILKESDLHVFTDKERELTRSPYDFTVIGDGLAASVSSGGDVVLASVRNGEVERAASAGRPSWTSSSLFHSVVVNKTVKIGSGNVLCLLPSGRHIAASGKAVFVLNIGEFLDAPPEEWGAIEDKHPCCISGPSAAAVGLTPVGLRHVAALGKKGCIRLYEWRADADEEEAGSVAIRRSDRVSEVQLRAAGPNDMAYPWCHDIRAVPPPLTGPLADDTQPGPLLLAVGDLKLSGSQHTCNMVLYRSDAAASGPPLVSLPCGMSTARFMAVCPAAHARQGLSASGDAVADGQWWEQAVAAVVYDDKMVEVVVVLVHPGSTGDCGDRAATGRQAYVPALDITVRLQRLWKRDFPHAERRSVAFMGPHLLLVDRPPTVVHVRSGEEVASVAGGGDLQYQYGMDMLRDGRVLGCSLNNGYGHLIAPSRGGFECVPARPPFDAQDPSIRTGCESAAHSPQLATFLPDWWPAAPRHCTWRFQADNYSRRKPVLLWRMATSRRIARRLGYLDSVAAASRPTERHDIG